MNDAYEVDAEAFVARAKFCAYTHARPDGSVFYVGKGLRRRAWDFAPSRRTAWHGNIVAKHGRDAIIVREVPCATECEAFALEIAIIACHRLAGAKLVNLTEGGEGAAGRKANSAQLAALALGRLKGKPGRKGLRPVLHAWIVSADGKAHSRRLGQEGKGRLHSERTLSCACCGIQFATSSAKAVACGKRCSQILYRRKS